MSQTYQTEGIVLARSNLGEADRLVTVLTPDYGLVKAVAPGARKYHSSLRGRMELFVVNELLIVKGRSIDRIIQAQTLESNNGLSGDLGKLSASQYLAELILCMALSEQPQADLYKVLLLHLKRLERLKESTELIPHLTGAVFHILTLAGIAPSADRCYLSNEAISPDFSQPNWYVGFSFENGGVLKISTDEQTRSKDLNAFEAKLGAEELGILQTLKDSELPQKGFKAEYNSWCKLEQILREYAEYHFNYSFRSSTLVNTLSQIEF